jgi:uncharacterized protein
MIHPDTELRFVSHQIGHGVFATKFIPKGTITYVDDPLEIHIHPDSPLLKHPVLGKILKVYSILENDGTYELSWDYAKHVNHCCHYNTITTGWGFDIAVRDIEAGEQIRDDYGMFNVDYDMALVCDFPDCRMYIRTADFDKYSDQWETDAQEALASASQVPQPLREVMDEQTRHELERYLQTRDGYRSVRELKFSLPEAG